MKNKQLKGRNNLVTTKSFAIHTDKIELKIGMLWGTVPYSLFRLCVMKTTIFQGLGTEDYQMEGNSVTYSATRWMEDLQCV